MPNALAIQNNTKKSLGLGVVGANGIGKTHIRIFRSLGVETLSILGSSKLSVDATGNNLKQLFRIYPQRFVDLRCFLMSSVDMVSICSPPESHFDQIYSALDLNIPVFCEKPLFWNEDWEYDEVVNKLGLLRDHPNRRIFVNTSNTVFVEHIKRLAFDHLCATTFIFKFHTQGSNIGRKIAVDLLPHGFSILQKLYGIDKPKHITYKLNTNQFLCNFEYKNISVSFEFKQHPNEEKLLSFVFDGREFQRRQRGSGDTYEVYLLDMLNEVEVQVPDPFFVYISRFIQSVRDDKRFYNDDFSEAAANMKNVAYLLELIDYV